MKFKNVADSISKFPTEENMFRLISYVETNSIHDEDIAYLAEILANSGERIKFNKNIPTADIPSTGGPSSLSTILCPLFLVEFGCKVPKISVPGSPAGGVDILSQIKNYKIHFSKLELEELLKKNSYIHSLADEIFCPLDILLFKFRKKINKLNIFPLVISSLLAKKIALGVRFVGLDIRVSPTGNFGINFSQAEENAYRFNTVAKLLGISSKCFLTDVRFPLQPFIGRGEALIATHEILENNFSNFTQSHFNVCLSMAGSTANFKFKKTCVIFNLKKHFQNNLIAQGSNYDNFLQKVSEIKQQPTFDIIASANGFVHIDLQKIKSAIVEGQKKAKSLNSEFADPCGCMLNIPHGSFVEKGDIIARMRSNSEISSLIFPKMQKAFSLNNSITHTGSYKEIL